MKKENRLVGALGGAGGSLVLGCLLSYLILPQTWNLRLLLTFEAIGLFLIVMAVVVHHEKKKGKRGLMLPAMFLIALLSFHI